MTRWIHSARRPAAVLGAAAAITALAAGSAATGAPSGRVASVAQGRSLFIANCGSCHTLRNARAKGTAGPNLDRKFKRTKKKTVRRIVLRTINNGADAMPAGILEGSDAASVASYVAKVTGRR